MQTFFLLNYNLTYIIVCFKKKVHTSPAYSAVGEFQICQGCYYLWFMTHLRIHMSENDLSHIDMVAYSVSSDTSQSLWVVRILSPLMYPRS